MARMFIIGEGFKDVPDGSNEYEPILNTKPQTGDLTDYQGYQIGQDTLKKQEDEKKKLEDQAIKDALVIRAKTTGELPSDAETRNYVISKLPTDFKEKDPAKSKIQQEAETSLKELEDIYLNGPEGPLALSKTGDVMRLGGRIEALKASQIAGENPQLKTYMAQLKTMGPRLAKLAGDTGNIALQEQLKALEGLPKPTDTLEEALMTINSTRRKFGLPERDLSAFSKGAAPTNNQSPQMQSIPGQTQQSSQMRSTTTGQNQQSANGFVNRLPNLPYEGIAGVTALFQKNPLISALTGLAGKSLGDISYAAQRVGKPISQMSEEEKQKLSGMSSPGYAGEQAKTAAIYGGGKIAQNALGFLLGGVKSAKDLASGQYNNINTIGKILGLPGVTSAGKPIADVTTVIPKMKELMTEKVTGQTVKGFNTYLKDSAEVYSKGKMPLKDLVSKAGQLSGAWKPGTAGEVKDAAVHAARAIERQAIREVISKSGPLYDILYKSAAGQAVTKSMVKKIWWLVPSLGAAVWGVGQIKEGLQGGQ